MNQVAIPETVEAPKEKKSLAVAAKEVLAPAMSEILKALPQSLKPEKFEAAFITAAINNPEILRCSAGSLRASLLKAAADGQLPDGRHAALVPHYNSKKGFSEATYIPMVKGIVNKAAALGGVNSITAEVVYENDTLSMNLADPAKTEHTFPGFNMDRGEVVGAYAIFRTKDGQVVHREIMTKDDIEKARNVSRMKSGTVWTKWYTEMVRKTVIRRGSKYVAMAPELATIIQRDDDHVDFGPRETEEGWNPLEDKDTLEGTATEVEGPSQDDIDAGLRMGSEIDELPDMDALTEWVTEWGEIIAELHDDVAKSVRSTINIRMRQLEEGK